MRQEKSSAQRQTRLLPERCHACARAAAGRAPWPVVRAWRTAAHLRCAVCQASTVQQAAKRTARAACTATLAAARHFLERTERRAAGRAPRCSTFAAGLHAQQHCRGTVQSGLVQSLRRDAGPAGRGRRHQPRLGRPARGAWRGCATSAFAPVSCLGPAQPKPRRQRHEH